MVPILRKRLDWNFEHLQQCILIAVRLQINALYESHVWISWELNEVYMEPIIIVFNNTFFDSNLLEMEHNLLKKITLQEKSVNIRSSVTVQIRNFV